MLVKLSGQNFEFPQQCACCADTPQTTLATSQTRSTGYKGMGPTTTMWWDFPYCLNCVQHVNAANLAISTTAFIILGSFVVALLCDFSPSSAWFSIWMASAGAIGGTFALSFLMAKAKAIRGAQCACLHGSVKYYGWQGNNHKFDIVSVEYALAFMSANEEKLVDVTPQILERLHANGTEKSTNLSQSVNKSVKL
jgi:hypothetical protein